MKTSIKAAVGEQRFANAPTDTNSAEIMKTRLQEYRNLNREIENQIERLERLETKMYSPSSPNLSGMPKAPSCVRDKFADNIARKMNWSRRYADSSPRETLNGKKSKISLES